MRLFVLFFSLIVAAACTTDVIDHDSLTVPADIGGDPDVGDPDIGGDPDAGDGGPCAACDPPRNGLFCGYDPSSCLTPVLACHADHSGDAIIVNFCGCDGVTFTPNRHGDDNADRPHQGRGDCLSTPVDSGPGGDGGGPDV